MGTPDIAAQCLAAILEEGRHEVCGVFTREDKPVGRKQVLTAPPAKQVALAHGLPVFQPKTLRSGEAADILRGLAPQLIVVVAYGRILPPDILGPAAARLYKPACVAAAEIPRCRAHPVGRAERRRRDGRYGDADGRGP